MLTLQIQGTEEVVSLLPRRVLMAGYTGRDRAAVQRHIEELRELGVPAPTRVPILFPSTVDRLTTAEEIEVLGGRTSGEAEYVLIYDHDQIYVAAGSDHTDRELERTSIVFAKQVCPNIISREVWPLAEVQDHWDSLILRAFAGAGASQRRYQEGTLAELLPPAELEALVRERVGGPLDGTVLFSGTMAIADGGGFFWGGPFAVELDDPVRGRRLRLAYRVRETPLTGDG